MIHVAINLPDAIVADFSVKRWSSRVAALARRCLRLTDIIFEASHRTYFQTRRLAASERAFISKSASFNLSNAEHVFVALRRCYTIAPGAISNLARLPLKKREIERKKEGNTELGKGEDKVRQLCGGSQARYCSSMYE